MSSPPDVPGSRIPPGLLLSAGVLLSYALSTGPVARLIGEGFFQADNSLIRILYLPLTSAMAHNELVRDLVFAYLDLWGVRIS